jgi:hypothetical protein
MEQRNKRLTDIDYQARILDCLVEAEKCTDPGLSDAFRGFARDWEKLERISIAER